ncbi:MAG TPA: ABC transporter ATP-binding protein [Vicinamibacterales bacterium]|jgi:iron complex transport system ATP-binding protein|nr:ABC transporter ATP-binding protein [Vicinamibacterales bacterium]
MTPSLRIDHVCWSVRGRTVLAGVTFDVRGGELVALMGKNGAGKSTLLDIVASLRQPHAGTVRLDDQPIQAWDPRARARLVAHLPQAVRPDLPFLAGELVLMGRYPHTDRWFESGDDRTAVERAMRRTDCWGLRDRVVQTLSGGERQRVLLAACFAQAPAVLLFDEPSTYLDIDQQLQCFSLLREECAQGAACLAVTHDLNLALAYATRIVVLGEGRVVLDLPVETATTTSDWLPLFSTRLTLADTPSGRPRVYYS